MVCLVSVLSHIILWNWEEAKMYGWKKNAPNPASFSVLKLFYRPCILNLSALTIGHFQSSLFGALICRSWAGLDSLVAKVRGLGSRIESSKFLRSTVSGLWYRLYILFTIFAIMEERPFFTLLKVFENGNDFGQLNVRKRACVLFVGV